MNPTIDLTKRLSNKIELVREFDFSDLPTNQLMDLFINLAFFCNHKLSAVFYSFCALDRHGWIEVNRLRPSVVAVYFPDVALG